MESEIEHFRGQLKDFEAISVFRSREFIDNHIANIVKPIEESLISRISKIEDQYNLGSNVQRGINTPVVYGKGKANFASGVNKKGNRIIIEGAPSDLQPLEIINELASVLEIPDLSNIKISYVKRWISGLGTEEERVLLRVCFDNTNDKYKFLSKAISKKLKDIEFSDRFYGVKIYPDRPYAEREHFKLLLNEAMRRNDVLNEGDKQKYIWVVRYGMVIKVRKRRSVDM